MIVVAMHWTSLMAGRALPELQLSSKRSQLACVSMAIMKSQDGLLL